MVVIQSLGASEIQTPKNQYAFELFSISKWIKTGIFTIQNDTLKDTS